MLHCLVPNDGKEYIITEWKIGGPVSKTNCSHCGKKITQ